VNEFTVLSVSAMERAVHCGTAAAHRSHQLVRRVTSAPLTTMCRCRRVCELPPRAEARTPGSGVRASTNTCATATSLSFKRRNQPCRHARDMGLSDIRRTGRRRIGSAASQRSGARPGFS
jgi:hypothetical protein